MHEERKNECVGRFERYLREAGVLDDELVAQARTDAEDAMRTGIAEAEAEQAPDPALLFEHAYAEPPPEIAAMLATELRSG